MTFSVKKNYMYILLKNLLCNREMMKRLKIVENDMSIFCKDVKENNEDLILRCKKKFNVSSMGHRSKMYKF